MTENIRNQCIKLYIDAFHDDIEFTNLLFDTFFEDSCRYLLIDDKVIKTLTLPIPSADESVSSSLFSNVDA